jgi:hypothetical protein
MTDEPNGDESSFGPASEYEDGVEDGDETAGQEQKGYEGESDD